MSADRPAPRLTDRRPPVPPWMRTAERPTKPPPVRGLRKLLWLLGLLLATTALSGCLRPAEEQVELDESVGLRDIGLAAITIVEGRAAVQGLVDGAATLWASAPTFEGRLTLDPVAQRSWTLTLRNVRPDAILTLDGVALEAAERPAPTEAIYTVELDPGAHDLRLVAPPPTGDRWRFAVLSDVQDAIDGAPKIIRLLEARGDVDFMVSAGDLTEQGEVDEYRRFTETFRALSVPFYGTPGNHERGADAANWTRAFGRANHSFRWRGARFSFVDSSFGTLDPTVYDWLDGWLEAGRDGVHVVTTHIPIMDPVGTRGGQFRSRNEAAKLLVRLARQDVDLVLFGHVHSYYAFSLAGVPSYISGGGGALPERLDGIGRHFLVVEVEDGVGIAGVEVVRVD